MARMSDRELRPLGPWTRGANNLAREDAVPAASFRRGVNVDVYPDGHIRRRKGLTLVDSTPTANMWGDGACTLCTSLDSSVLYRFTPGQDLQPLYTGLRPEADIAYCSVNNVIYVSDGAVALRVDPADDSVRPWGVPTPSAQPLLQVAAGGLPAGAYQVAITYVTADGEEGGAAQAATITVPDNSGIRATLSAPILPAHVAHINIYLTRAGDARLRFYTRRPAGAFDIVLGVQTLGRELRTMGLEPMPAGSAAALVGGKLAVVAGNIVHFSDPLNFGLTNYAKSYIAYPSPIDVFAPTALGATADGAFIASGARTYFVVGNDLATGSNRLAYGFGGVRGRPEYINGDALAIQGMPPQPLPAWLALNGMVCVGLPSGQVMALTLGRYAMRTGDNVTMARRNIEGIDQLVVNVREPAPQAYGATSDTADSILIRNGVVIP